MKTIEGTTLWKASVESAGRASAFFSDAVIALSTAAFTDAAVCAGALSGDELRRSTQAEPPRPNATSPTATRFERKCNDDRVVLGTGTSVDPIGVLSHSS